MFRVFKLSALAVLVLAGCKKSLTFDIAVEGDATPFKIECLPVNEFFKSAMSMGQFKPTPVFQDVTPVDGKVVAEFKLEKVPSICAIGQNTIKFHEGDQTSDGFELVNDAKLSFRYNTSTKEMFKVDAADSKGYRVLSKDEIKTIQESLVKKL